MITFWVFYSPESPDGKTPRLETSSTTVQDSGEVKSLGTEPTGGVGRPGTGFGDTRVSWTVRPEGRGGGPKVGKPSTSCSLSLLVGTRERKGWGGPTGTDGDGCTGVEDPVWSPPVCTRVVLRGERKPANRLRLGPRPTSPSPGARASSRCPLSSLSPAPTPDFGGRRGTGYLGTRPNGTVATTDCPTPSVSRVTSSRCVSGSA